jgi:hypothetical protein
MKCDGTIKCILLFDISLVLNIFTAFYFLFNMRWQFYPPVVLSPVCFSSLPRRADAWQRCRLKRADRLAGGV